VTDLPAIDMLLAQARSTLDRVRPERLAEGVPGLALDTVVRDSQSARTSVNIAK
jgi:hypothetical protein